MREKVEALEKKIVEDEENEIKALRKRLDELEEENEIFYDADETLKSSEDDFRDFE